MPSDHLVTSFYQGKDKDFIVFAESEESIKKYLKDSTVPLSQVVGNFKIYTTASGRGADGQLEEASKIDLDNEFGSKSNDEIIKEILEKGSVKNHPNVAKNIWRSTNDSMGPRN